jgi:hypothetical protein
LPAGTALDLNLVALLLKACPEAAAVQIMGILSYYAAPRKAIMGRGHIRNCDDKDAVVTDSLSHSTVWTHFHIILRQQPSNLLYCWGHSLRVLEVVCDASPMLSRKITLTQHH